MKFTALILAFLLGVPYLGHSQLFRTFVASDKFETTSRLTINTEGEIFSLIFQSDLDGKSPRWFLYKLLPTGEVSGSTEVSFPDSKIHTAEVYAHGDSVYILGTRHDVTLNAYFPFLMSVDKHLGSLRIQAFDTLQGIITSSSNMIIGDTLVCGFVHENTSSTSKALLTIDLLKGELVNYRSLYSLYEITEVVPFHSKGFYHLVHDYTSGSGGIKLFDISLGATTSSCCESSPSFISFGSYAKTSDTTYFVNGLNYTPKPGWTTNEDLAIHKINYDVTPLDSIVLVTDNALENFGDISGHTYDSIYWGGTTPFYEYPSMWYPADRHFLLNLIDSEGNIRWQRLYGDSGSYMLSAIRSTPDGGCIMAGNYWDWRTKPVGDLDAVFIKIDKNGSTVGATKIEEEKAVHVYPNPTTGKVIFSCTEPQIQEYYITDVTGKVISSGTLEPGKTSVEIPGAAGVYFYRAGKEAGKIIKK